MSKLLLIDGSNYLFRAFHALPDLRTSRGEPTGALRGFFGMLGKVWKMTDPDRAAIVFDAKGKTFRHEMFPDYKANRPPMPDDLRVQIDPLKQMLVDLGWPLIEVPGVEADDVLATLAESGRRAGMKSIIASGDKDMAQLVDDDIVLINTMNTKLYDREGVIEKYGVAPERIIDYLALMGDKVDNVPGINKCGPKTAVKWIEQFGGLEQIKARADEVPGKVGQYLREGLPFLDKARDLVTIKRDCVLPDNWQNPNDLIVKPADTALLEAFSRRWEMSPRSLRSAAVGGVTAAVAAVATSAPAAPAAPAGDAAQGSLFDMPAAGEAAKPAKEPAAKPAPVMPVEAVLDADAPVDAVPFTVIETVMDLECLASDLAAAPAAMPVALTPMYDGSCRHAEPVALGIALTANDVRVVRFSPALGVADFKAAAGAWIESDKPKVAHDAKDVWHVFRGLGLMPGGVWHDTRLMSYVMEAHLKHDLVSVARRHLSRVLPERETVFGKGARALTASQVPQEALETLAAEEVAATRALSSYLLGCLSREKDLESIYTELECPLMQVLARMEDTGVAVDSFELTRQADELGLRIDRLQSEAYEMAGREFNLSSPKQLGEVLFGDLKIPVVKKTASGAPSTNEDVLTELALDYPLPKLILEYRRLTKLKSTYLDKLPRMMDPVDGRIHTTFGQATAVTGRLVSSDPNLQNIPVRTPEGRRVREAFVAEGDNLIVSADYSQIELRIMAHLSQDAGLLDAFAKGRDIHRATAAEVFSREPEKVTDDERRMAKVINFGLIYGMSAFGLAQNLGIERRVAAHYIDEYFARYPGVKRYMEEKRLQCREQGYVETAFGRRLWVPDIFSTRKPVQAAAERAAINAPMQGTAADLIKRAMIDVDRWLREEKLASRLILQVHDELILEVPPAELELVRTKVPEIMAAAAKLDVPLIADVGVGVNWEEAH